MTSLTRWEVHVLQFQFQHFEEKIKRDVGRNTPHGNGTLLNGECQVVWQCHLPLLSNCTTLTLSHALSATLPWIHLDWINNPTKKNFNHPTSHMKYTLIQPPSSSTLQNGLTRPRWPIGSCDHSFNKPWKWPIIRAQTRAQRETRIHHVLTGATISSLSRQAKILSIWILDLEMPPLIATRSSWPQL
jgi:hypothetical protein